MSGVTQAVFMNQRSFGTPFFFGRIGDTSVNQSDQLLSTSFDVPDNFITSGNQGLFQANGTPIGNRVGTLFKIEPDKTIALKKKYSQTSNDIQFISSATDSSNNIYMAGIQTASGIFRVLLTKVDSSGVLQWSRRLGIATGSAFLHGVGVDSSGNVYVGGYTTLITGTDKIAFLLAKYNSSGTIQWQKKLYQSVGNNVTQSFSVDSSGNVYVGGYSTLIAGPPSTTRGTISKYDSSGTIQWQKHFGEGAAGSFGNASSIAVNNSTGDIYVGCSNFNATTSASTRFLQKLDSSGTVQWQRSYTGSSLNAISLDSSGNVYFCGEGTGSPPYRGHIVKYDDSGVIQWQRRIDATLSGQNFKYWWAIATDSNDQLGVTGITGQGPGGNNNNNGMIARYPNDGAFTGAVTVDSITYTTTVATGTDGSLSTALSVASLVSSNAGLTDESVSLTEATITTPVNLVDI